MTYIPCNTIQKQYNTIQYKNNTIQYKMIQSNTRQYSIYIYIYMAGTPQQLKPITVGPFNI
jgi:hypothetical protein